MIKTPRTIEEACAYRFGRWGGQPNGSAYVAGRCAYPVCPNERAPVSHQCMRTDGYGPAGLYCKQHAKMVAAAEEDNG